MDSDQDSTDCDDAGPVSPPLDPVPVDPLGPVRGLGIGLAVSALLWILLAWLWLR